MKLTKKAGFTIIETMLVMAITGLLVIGVLVGTGSSISRQRYSDSVYSLQSYLQGQYAEVANTVNDISGALRASCSGNRGQSDCVVLGKIIHTSKLNGITSKLSSSTVVGTIPSTSIYTNDELALKGYLARELSDSTEYQVEWGSRLMSAGNGGDIDFTIIIVRSPISGVIRTYIYNSNLSLNNSSFDTLINSTNSGNTIRLCITDADNKIINSLRRSVFINSNASSQNGIEILSESVSGC